MTQAALDELLAKQGMKPNPRPGWEANMTVIMDVQPTTAAAGDSIQRSDFGASTSWATAACRAHALLSQTMPDEEIDELIDAAVPFDQAMFKLPRFLFG